MKRAIFAMIISMLTLSAAAQHKLPEIVAHRGYHQEGGAPNNSIEALKMAQKEGFEWVEFDVNLTADGELLILHGPWHPGAKAKNRVNVQLGTKSEVQAIPLSNGERVPTFEEWIAQAAKCKKTKMLIEIKGCTTPARDTEIVEKIQAVLKKYKMHDNVAYLVNHEFLIHELVRLAPKGVTITFSVGSYTPTYCHAIGCNLAGRTYASWRKNPNYIEEARALGMKTMAWTVNNPDHIEWLVEQGFDYIITDDPIMMRSVLKRYRK